jgi:hypothetical protein
MGTSVYYWAVPPSSALFKRLERDKAFVTLMAALFHRGAGVFYFFDELEDNEREEILQSVIKHRQERLGPKPEARRLIEEFRQELARTRLDYPGVERRRGSLDKISFLVAERLTQALKPGRKYGEKFVDKLIYGDRTLGKTDPDNAQTMPEDLDNTVGVISAPLVQEGANVLSGLKAEELFGNDLVWQWENFQEWRRLFQEAAAAGDALLAGVA